MRECAATIGNLALVACLAGVACGKGAAALARADGGGEVEGGSTHSRDASSASVCPDEPECDAGPCPAVRLPGGADRSVGRLAAGGGRVYWIDVGSAVYAADGTVGYVEHCGAGGSQIASQQPDPFDLVADGSGACWTSFGQTVGGQYRNDGLVVCWGSGGLQVLASGQDAPSGIALGSGATYWVDEHTAFAMARVFVAGRAGGAPSSVYDATYSGDPLSLAADAASLYLAGAGKVLAIDHASGTAVVLAQGSWDIRSVAIDVTNVYFPDVDAPHFSAPGQVLSVPKGGGSVTVLAAMNGVGNQIATDGRYVYFVAEGAVQRVPTTGGAPEVLAYQADRYALAADGVYVYFAYGPGVYRVLSP